MIKLIVGNKGSGKTKLLIDLINKAAKVTSGNIVCIEKGLKLTYDIDYSVRLIDIENYGIVGYEAFYGFISGICAGNYDITEIFIDATLKVGGRDLAAFANMVQQLEKLTTENKVEITFTVSCDKSELPEELNPYII